MPRVRSIVLALLSAVLASIVLIGATTTSQANFAASTDNRSNLWETATLALDVGGEEPATARLFLHADNLYPGPTISNCISLTTTSSLAAIDVRLHGVAGAEGLLGAYFDVTVERAAPGSDCRRFLPDEVIFAGTLQALIDDHGSYGTGLPITTEPGADTHLRFTGRVQDDNQAQGLRLDYLMLLEARP